MSSRSVFRRFVVCGVAASLFACTSEPSTFHSLRTDPALAPPDVARALAALPEAEVVESADDGVPTFVRGELGRLAPGAPADGAALEVAVRGALAPALAAFRLSTGDLWLRKVNTDFAGSRHLRYQQRLNGLEVIGGDLVVHVDRKGVIYGVNGTARGDFPARLGASDIGAQEALARVKADARFAGMSVSLTRAVYLITLEGRQLKAYEVVAEGTRGQDPARDKVYVNVDSGELAAVYPQIHFAKSRRVYTANNATTLPGTLKRSEGGAANTDVDVNAAYDNTGATYDAYNNYFGRDSYDNAGAALVSTVHYSRNYCNAFWNSTQMVYGDGNGADCLPLARALDVTAHELTHAVTEEESGLVYSGESGGLNEAMSDIFGAFVEAWVDGGKTGPLAVSPDTWLVGEEILPPALRYMNDPAADGASRDFWTSTVGSVDVHYSSGIANLAFYLMSQGGVHPRGKSSVQVTGIGMAKAVRVFYKANTDILTSSAKFLAARNACISAAAELGLTQEEKDGVQNAWAAVGVGAAVGNPGTDAGTADAGTGTDGGTSTDTPLTNNVPVTELSGSTGAKAYFKLDVPAGATGLSFAISGGTGDADMYVKFGARPSTTAYDCRPYLNGSTETCTITTAQAGTYYVMLNAYSAYSGVSLVGKYTVGGGDGVTVLVDGVPVTGVTGTTGSTQYWKIQTPVGATLSVSISGGTGDADLYTRFGSKPTTTAYDCRPYKAGNAETCTVSGTQAGYYYVMLRAYSTYSGVTLSGSY